MNIAIPSAGNIGTALRHVFSSVRAPFLLLLLGATLVAACDSGGTDDPDAGEYFVRFSAGETPISFTRQGSIVGTFAQSGNQHNAIFTGYDETTGIHLQIYDREAVTEQTYSGYGFETDAVVGVLIGYYNADGSYASGASPTEETRVVVSEITETSVRGTFQGTVKADGLPDLALTEGEFFVQRTP